MEFPYRDGSFNRILINNSLNAVLISDLHLVDDGSSYFSMNSIEQTLTVLPALINQVKPNQLFILGDLFHSGQTNNHFVVKVMKMLYEFPLEVFLIGGNHDRGLIYDLIVGWSKDNLHIFSDFFLTYETEYDKIWLTHDGKNPYWLEKSMVISFLEALKTVYKLDKQHWLITGHIHFPCILEANKVASLGCFNVGGHNQPLSYGLIREKGNQIVFSLHHVNK